MNPTELHEAFERVTATEPPLHLDADLVVTGGRARLRRRRALTTAGGAVLTAAVLAVPVALWAGAGSGGQLAGGARTGPTIEPTPGDPHGGCRGETHSGSTQGHVFAEWFLRQLPGTYQFQTDPGWQNSYTNDCVDGAKFDTNEAGARVVGHDGDLFIVTARNDPAEPIREPCKPPPGPTANPTAEKVGGTGSTASGPAEPRLVYDRCETHSRPDGSTVTIEESHETGSENYHARAVTWWRTDGTTVRLDVDNRHVLDDSERNPQPVLTVDQMVALVTDPDVLLYLPPVR